jgi:hypothetical protein
MHFLKRLYVSLLTGLFLLFSQQGAVLHEFSHVAEHAVLADHQSHHEDHAPCDACLSYAHLAFAFALDIPTLGLLTQLKHELVATPVVAQAVVLALLPRSRGPPSDL